MNEPEAKDHMGDSRVKIPTRRASIETNGVVSSVSDKIRQNLLAIALVEPNLMLLERVQY